MFENASTSFKADASARDSVLGAVASRLITPVTKSAKLANLRSLLVGASFLMGAIACAASGVELESGNTLTISHAEFSRFLPHAFYDQAMSSLPHVYPKHVVLVSRRTGELGEVRYALVCFKESPASERVAIQAVAVHGRQAWRLETSAPLAYEATLVEVLEQISKLPVVGSRTRSGSVGYPGGAAEARGPSFACDKVTAGSIEAMICEDKELSALDRKLSGVYAAASKRATNERPPRLKAEQRGWVKGRNECRKSDAKRQCVTDTYQRRIAELQAKYRLVPGKGPVRFVCEGNPANEVVATFFQTTPPTLIAERGDSVSLMYVQPSGSGARYQGRNESLWEHQGEALITWGHGTSAMRCKKVR